MADAATMGLCATCQHCGSVARAKGSAFFCLLSSIPAFLSTTAIGVMAFIELLRGVPISTSHATEVE